MMATIKVEVDTLAVCRVCLQEGEDDMSSIYERDASDSALCIFEKIEKCGGIKILKDPELPTRICNKCKAFLTIAHKFRIICKNSDNYLREFVCKAKCDADDETSDFLYDYKQNIDELIVDDNIIISHEAPTDCIEVSQEPLDYEEVEEYTELWLNEDDNDLIEEDHIENEEAAVIETQTNNKISATTASTTNKKKKNYKNTSKKTLGISSDGTPLIHVKTNEKQMHICEICGNTYNRKFALDAHMRRHRDEKPFECEICHQAFHLNFQLTRHIRKHTGIRPYTCSYCKRSFADRSTMVKHERIHRNERPYKCDTCGKTFTYSSVLKVHMLTHTGEKPFTCGICGKRFARGHHLRAHLETQLHQYDPRVKVLLKQINRQEGQNEDEIINE